MKEKTLEEEWKYETQKEEVKKEKEKETKKGKIRMKKMKKNMWSVFFHSNLVRVV